MALQFIFGNPGSGKSHYLYEHIIRESMKHPDINYIILVPEQFTMQTQKELVLRHPRHGIMNIDVLSFARLAFRVLEETGNGSREILDDEGKNLILRRLAGKKEDSLKVLKGNIKKPGYISEVKSVISELTQYNISPDGMDDMITEADESSYLAWKLKDIQVMYQAFEEYLADKYITKEEILDILCNVMDKSRMLKDSVIALDGFTGFTPLQNKVLGEMLHHCQKVMITVTMDKREDPYVMKDKYQLFALSKQMVTSLVKIAGEEKVLVEEPVCLYQEPVWRFRNAPALAFLEKELFRYSGRTYREKQSNVRVYAAANPRMEVECAAQRIRFLIRKKEYRYREIAVIASDMNLYADEIEKTFREYEIPVFMDYKRNVLLNSFVEYIRSLLAMAEQNFSAESVFRFLRTDLVGFTGEELDLLENYVLALGIRGYKKWQEKWIRRAKDTTEEELEVLNHLRVCFVEKTEDLVFVLKQRQKTVRDVTLAICEFLEKEEIQKQVKVLENQFTEAGELALAKEYAQIYRVVMELFDKFVSLLGDERIALKEYRELLDAGMEEARIGVIPPSLDEVMAGDIERTRLKDIRALILLGVNDSLIPGNASAGGLISDRDRERFEERGIALAPGTREKSYIQKFYLYLMMTKASHRLYLSYAKKSSDGKTALPSYLIRNVRRMFPDVRITDADGQDGQFVYLKIPKQDIEWNTENYIKTLSENAALLLYGTQLKGSISAFETYASCRFAYFLEYGLKLSQREEYRFAVQDFGTVLHGVLEDVSRQLKEEKKSFSLLSDEERKKRVSESVVRIAAEYGNTILKDNSRNEYMIKRLTDLADRTVWAIGKQLERGEFAPDAYEMNFLVDEHEVLGDKSLYMQGKIDRIDICEDDNNVYVRVVDYKTGKSDFDLLKTFYGLKLQLVTYMKAAQRIEKKRHPDKNIIPAGILYYNIDNPIIEVQSMPDEEDADYREAVDEMILENLRMKGVVNEDTEIIRKMDDRGGKSAVIPVAFKSNGELDMRSHIYSTQKFEQLTDYVTEKSADMAAGIFGGNVDVNPYHTQKEDACTYCPYHAVCGFSPDIPGGQSRSLKTFSDEEIWKKIREGVDENGKPLDRKTVQGNPDKRL